MVKKKHLCAGISPILYLPKTFDVLLCAGTSSISRKIQGFNWLSGVKGEAAQISHVAMVVYISHSMAHWLDLPCAGNYVMESTTLNKWTAAKKRGFQLNLYDDWIENYRGGVWSRPIILDAGGERPWQGEIGDERRIEFIEQHRGKDYESGIPGVWELLLCGLRLHVLPSIKRLHCSETNVLALQFHNMFDKKKLANNFPPYTFWEGGEFEKYLQGCFIGPAVSIK